MKCDRIFVLTVTIWTYDFFSLLIKTRTFHENEPVHGPCPVVPLSFRVRLSCGSVHGQRRS